MQTFKNIEIILIDDGSTDASPAICDNLCATDKRIKVIHQKNQGVSAARNAGMLMASGDWIMFVDGDDWLDLDAAEFLLQRADDEHDIIAASYSWEIHESCFRHASPCTQEEYSYDGSTMRKYLLGQCLLPPRIIPKLFPQEMQNCPRFGTMCAKLYKASMLRDLGLVNEVGKKLGEDILFNLKVLSLVGKIKYIDRSIYHYFNRKNSSNNTPQLQERCDEYISELKTTLEILSQINQIDEIQIYLSYYCYNFFKLVAQIIGMKQDFISSFLVYRKILVNFSQSLENNNTDTKIKLCAIKPIREKLMYYLYSRKLYCLAMLICWIYYKIFSFKKRFSD